MDIVVIKKPEGVKCSYCYDVIEQGEEAFKFWNKVQPRKSNPEYVMPYHIRVGNGELHFRHLLCQFNSKPRNVSFEEYIKNIKFQIELTKNKKKFEKGIING